MTDRGPILRWQCQGGRDCQTWHCTLHLFTCVPTLLMTLGLSESMDET